MGATRRIAGIVLGAVVAAFGLAAPSASQPGAVTFQITPFDGRVYEVNDGLARLLGYEEWQMLGFPTPSLAEIDYVGYAWSPGPTRAT